MADWSPARPDRAVPGWRDATALAPPQAVSQVREPAAFDPAPLPPRRRRPPIWRRSPRRAIALAFAVLALGTAVITGVGASLTPSYGSLPPYGVSGVVDVRSTPHAVGWTTNLARSILPGVPTRCVSFTASQSSGTLVVLAGSPLPLGSSTDCTSFTANQVQSTVALFDAATGRVLWTKDLRTIYPDNTGAVTLQQSTIVPQAKTVVVQTTVASLDGIATLSIATGRVTGSVQHPSDAAGQTPEIAGSAVLFAAGTSRPGATAWTLSSASRLDRPLWSAILPDSDYPRLTDRAAFATIDGRSERIDGKTGRITPLGDGTIDLSNALEDASGLYTTQVIQSGTIVTAWDSDGRRLWSRSGVGDLSGVSRDCVVVALPGTTKLTCLDRADGRGRWTTDVGSLAYATSLPGQTTSDVAVYRSRSNGIEIVLLNGHTGKEEYILPLEALTAVIAVSRTTGYLRTASETGSSTGLTAFDTRTGQTLWSRTTRAEGDTELWGGHLISIDASHVARELGVRPPMILGG